MKELTQCKTEVGIQVENLNAEFKGHKSDFTQLLAEWTAFKKDFEAMLTIFKSAEGFFKVLGWVGSAAKWTIGVGVLVVAIWTLITTGHWPGVGK